ncbi:putative bifunctional diguanylate cyclase/phosphodiesterase [Roseateles microcysteis]
MPNWLAPWLIGLAYFLAGLPTILASPAGHEYLIGTGLALAGLSLVGPRLLPALFCASLLLGLLGNLPLQWAFFQAIAELLGPGLGAMLLRQMPWRSLDRWSGRLAFLVFGVALPPLLSSLGLLALRSLSEPVAPDILSGSLWLGVAGRALGVLGLGLPILWLGRRYQQSQLEQLAWQGLTDQTSSGTCEWDLQTGHKQASANWQAWAGAEGDWLGWLEHSHPLDRSAILASLQELQTQPGKESFDTTLRLRIKPGGEWRDFRLHLQVLRRDRHGKAERLRTLLHDVDWERSSAERQRLATHLFQHLNEGLAVVDPQFMVVDVNPSYCRMLRAERERLLKQPALPLSSAVLGDAGHDLAVVRETLRATGLWQGQIRVRRSDGELCAFQLTLSSVQEAAGPARYHVLTLADSRSQPLPDELAQQARQDHLTGLPTHRELLHMLEEALPLSQREGFMLCVCCVDLDGFRQLNERHGQAAGDQLIHQVAQRLLHALRSAPQWRDLLARLNGDEFALVLRCRNQEEAQLALERLLNVLRAPHVLPGSSAPLSLTASIGATLYPLDPSDGETLLRHATQALHQVKRNGRDAARFFDTEKRARKEAQALALARMQEALDSQELRLYYQPKVDMRHAKVLGVEALLRWQHPQRGLLAPAHFLPLLEGTGLGVRVGDWVIEQALKQSAAWLGLGLRLDVSVNVAARHLQSADFGQRLQELLGRHDPLVAHHLTLEVLESAALADVDATHALLQRCRRLGVRSALDDFGTGYANLTYLKRLPVDVLKIDRSFVQSMLADEQDRAIVEGVIKLAQSFGCGVIAEGVESPAHAQALLKLGCTQGQGSGIASPMPADEVAAWVQGFVRGGWPGPVRQPITVD